MIRIDIKSLKPGIHHFEWSPDATELELDSDLFGNLYVAARLDFHPARIYVVLQTRALAHLICDRTLKAFDEEVEGEHQILFSNDQIVDDVEAQEDDGMKILPQGAEEIDLTDVVRDTFILSIPARKVAPGAEAEEIPLEFGAPDGEGAIDPRWEALRKLSSLSEDDDSKE